MSIGAVDDVHFGKVILNCGRLDGGLREAIGHAHEAEEATGVGEPGPARDFPHRHIREFAGGCQRE